MHPTEEGGLIADFLRGDRAAIELLDEWIEVVLRAHFLSARAEWDDLKQEVRTRVFRNLRRGDFGGRSALRTYVHRIAKNVCIDLMRSNERRRHFDLLAESDPAAGEQAGGGVSAWIARDLLRKILGGFSQEDRLLIEMVFLEHCSYAEVAARLSIPEGTVKSRMFRCKNRILEKRRALIEREGSAS